MSHTVTVKTEFKNPDALGDAARKLGGEVLGKGNHRLFGGYEEGYGFKLPGWNYPLVLTKGGELKFDDYNGAWGNRADIEKMKAEYMMAAAEAKCRDLGWMYERRGADLVIFVDQAEVLVTSDGKIDAIGFQGQGCASAVDAIASALGSETSRHVKPEYGQVQTEAKQVV